ncbi:hypothetical protein M8J75_004231 [Diaphorina citri]|nr:hypothetical protein M8J75_004231 [Diaphorina citri]
MPHSEILQHWGEWSEDLHFESLKGGFQYRRTGAYIYNSTGKDAHWKRFGSEQERGSEALYFKYSEMEAS